LDSSSSTNITGRYGIDPILFTGTSHPELAKEVASNLNWKLGDVAISRFPDGEIDLQIQENVRGCDVFVMQTTALHPNYYLMELLAMIDALRRASARSIGVIVPYLGYCRQDRKDRPRVPITAKLVANLLQEAGATRILTMDLHADQVQGFFDIPVDNLYGRVVLQQAIQELGLENMVVVAPDVGSIKLVRVIANAFGVDFAIVDKHRVDANHVAYTQVIGDVSGKDVLLADDMCSTAGTLASAAKACREKGANRIVAAFTHGLFVGPAIERIENSPIEVLLYCNTIPDTERLEGATKLKMVTVAPLLARAIQCLLSSESISSLFAMRQIGPGATTS
jgi:ribose-phosphate pyrophosphokinase